MAAIKKSNIPKKLPPGQRTLNDMNEAMDTQENRKRTRIFVDSPSPKSDDSQASPAMKRGAQRNGIIDKENLPPNDNEDPLAKANLINGGRRVSGDKEKVPVKIHSPKKGENTLGGGDNHREGGLDFLALIASLESRIEKRLSSHFLELKADFSVFGKHFGKFQDQLQGVHDGMSNLRARTAKLEREALVPPPAPHFDDRGYAERFEKVEFDILRAEAKILYSNLLIDGLPETPNEDEAALAQKVLDFCQNILATTGVAIDEASRMGRPRKDGTARTTFIHFTKSRYRKSVWSARDKLRTKENSKYRLKEDCPRKLKQLNALLLQIAYVAKQKKNEYDSAVVTNFVLYVNYRPYFPWDLNKLPAELTPERVCTPESDLAVVFFTGYSPLSNHHTSPFELDGNKYNNVEQYLAYEKANMAGDARLMDKALHTENPADCKVILNSLREPQLVNKWNEAAYDLAKRSLIAKFQQNRDLATFLLETYPKRLGEASANKIWGIGLSIYSPDRLSCDKWRGQNILGRAMQAVREIIRDEANAGNLGFAPFQGILGRDEQDGSE